MWTCLVWADGSYWLNLSVYHSSYMQPRLRMCISKGSKKNKALQDAIFEYAKKCEKEKMKEEGIALRKEGLGFSAEEIESGTDRQRSREREEKERV